jgi:hypothetical protein
VAYELRPCFGLVFARTQKEVLFPLHVTTKQISSHSMNLTTGVTRMSSTPGAAGDFWLRNKNSDTVDWNILLLIDSTDIYLKYNQG